MHSVRISSKCNKKTQLIRFVLLSLFSRDPAIGGAHARDTLPPAAGQCESQALETAPTNGNGNSRNLPEFTKLPFSTQFLLQVVCRVSDQVDRGLACARYDDDLNVIPSDTGTDEEKLPSLSSDDTPLTISSRTPTVRLRSEDRLWQEIMDNIKKDLGKRTHIALSLTTAATIAAAAVSQRRDWHNDAADQSSQQAHVDVIVFTCGHQFPKYYFNDVIIPEFQQRMAELMLPLPQTTKLLMGYYGNRESLLPTACPSCVYNCLRKEQLQIGLERENIEYTRAKPWEI